MMNQNHKLTGAYDECVQHLNGGFTAPASRLQQYPKTVTTKSPYFAASTSQPQTSHLPCSQTLLTHHMSMMNVSSAPASMSAGKVEAGAQSRMIPVDGMMMAPQPSDGQHGQATTTVENLAGELPLQDRWSFYFLKNDHTRSWMDNLVFIGTVSTVEQFWS